MSKSKNGKAENQEFGMQHAVSCATGARAEERGPCDCGAVATMPWRMRAVRDPVSDDDRIELYFESMTINTRDAVTFALTLQDFAIKTAHANIARHERENRRQAIKDSNEANRG